MTTLALLTLAAAAPAPSAPPADPPTCERWGVFEIALDGPREGNPFVDVPVSARFTHGDQTVEVEGFYDGDGTYRVRFMPDALGAWRYETKSPRPELNGKRGTFTCTAPAAGNHGPVQVRDTYHFAYADGTRYHQVGTTCYVWTHQPAALQEQTLKTLAASPFNKIRFCVFPKSYAYNRNEPERFPFARGADGKFDHARPDPLFWRHFEGRVADLMRLGIEADIILWHPYDRWGFSEMDKEADDRYLRYTVARLAAYRNVWWSLANEFDLMAPAAMKGHRGNKEMADWDRFFQILQRHDPYGRLRGIHNCRGFYDHTKPWVTHASIQRHDLPTVFQWREQFRKPIVIDECCYEGNIPQGWGKISAQEMVRRFWIGTARGGYVGHGETYLHPEEILWWSKGGVLHGESPARIAFLKQIVAAMPFHEMVPLPEPAPGVYPLVKPGEQVLVYFANASRAVITLAGDRPYKVDGIDPWEMKVVSLGNAAPGEFAFTAPKADYLLRFTAYRPGEPLRPELKATAAPAEGKAPLQVRFACDTPLKARWEFGDGATAEGASPEHTYAQEGLYVASVTVTDAAGESTTAVVRVAVDGDPSRPRVRAGFRDGETPGVRLNGPVTRAEDGSFSLPDGAPWRWVSVGDKPVAALEGLRSFTILGWVKPESLAIGSGGNRILCTLNHQGSGIDLVHLADGSLRLAVNGWPDTVRDDSSPGRLAVGRWSFFAVTYDSTKERDNVCWYFGAEGAPAALDRAAAYNAGPTGADSGPLSIGNYNETMHRYGLDRQFRGHIRGVRLFGSRVGSLGALAIEGIRREQGE